MKRKSHMDSIITILEFNESINEKIVRFLLFTSFDLSSSQEIFFLALRSGNLTQGCLSCSRTAFNDNHGRTALLSRENRGST